MAGAPTSAGLRASRGAWGLAALYVLLGAASFHDDRYLDAQGLQAQLASALVARDVVPAVFLQSLRPPTAMLYAWFVPLGPRAFGWAHVLVCALAVPLTAATARRLGHAAPNVAAAVVALSPMFVAGGAAGLPGADAVVGVSVVAWLWATDRVGWASLVLGTLLWVQPALWVGALAMAVWAGVRRRPRAVLGLLGWPVVYGLAGAVYHQYLPWMLHYPLASLGPPSPAARGLDLLDVAVALSPAAVATAFTRPGQWTALERGWWATAGTAALAVVVLPLSSPRALLPLLPVVALAVGRATERWHEASPRAIALLLAAAGLGVVHHRTGGTLALTWATLGVAGAATCAGAGRPRIALGVLLCLLAMGPRHLGTGAKIDRVAAVPALEEMVARIAEFNPDGARPIVTDEPLLAAYLARGGGMPRAVVWLRTTPARMDALVARTNPANGQRARIVAAWSQGLYGTPIVVDSPADLPAEALLVLHRDPTQAPDAPPSIAGEVLQLVSHSARVTLAERQPGAGR